MSQGNDVILREIDNLSAMYALRDQQAAQLQQTEALIRAIESGILAAMNAAQIVTIGGAHKTATITIDRVYKGEDWPRLYERIRTTGEFDLLHRRLSIPAVREREQAGDLPQGVVGVDLQRLKLSTTK